MCKDLKSRDALQYARPPACSVDIGHVAQHMLLEWPSLNWRAGVWPFTVNMVEGEAPRN